MQPRRFGAWASVIYATSVLLCILVSFFAAVPTIPKSRKPFMQALWYVGLVGFVPATAAFFLLSHLELMSDPYADYLENLGFS